MQKRRKVAGELLEPNTTGKLAVTFSSFGHKHGPPRDADLAFDVRFLPNPHWDPELRPLTGYDSRIADYVGRNIPTSRQQTVQVRLTEIDGHDEVEVQG